MKTPKAKGKALAMVPQSREAVVAAIARAGELMARVAARRAQADAEVRAAGEALERDVTQPLAELEEVRRGIQAWCEAHRAEITEGGRVKHHDFGTGRVLWRSRPPKVGLRQVEKVIAAVKALGLVQFLRVREEVNKEAMLSDPERARQVAGVTIASEGEDFVIEPVEIGGPS
jgi:phage host-nuclease inhibitor protein Gam